MMAMQAQAVVTVDVHAHRECAQVREQMRPIETKMNRRPLAVGNHRTRQVNTQMLESVRPQMDQLEVRLMDMDEAGVDFQVISVTPYQFYYWLDPSDGVAIAE